MTDFNGSEVAAQQAERVAGIIRDREKSHGDAVKQHEALAALWSKHLGVEVSAMDAMYMLLLLKVSRIETAGLAQEHIEDIAGYACLIMGERSIAMERMLEAQAKARQPKPL